MPYPFFLSYARNDDHPTNPDPVVQEFVTELNRRVRYYTGAFCDGFRDRTALVSGQLWRDALFGGLQESASLVCLYSPSFFASEHCGKEMQVFLNRRRKYIRDNVGKKPANIIPILWHSCKQIPKTLPDFQYRASNLDPSKYGVWNLGDRKRFDLAKAGEFYNIIDDIALRIRDVANDTPLPTLDEVMPIEAIANAFDHPSLPLTEFDSPDAVAGPDSVTFVYATPPAWDQWPHSPPREQAVLRISATIARGKEFDPHQLSFEPSRSDLIARLDDARDRNNVVIVFIDGASIAQPALRERLIEYDQRQYDTFCTMVIWNGNRTAEREKDVKETLRFFSSRKPPFFHLSISDPEEFEKAITSSLELLKSEVLKKPRATKPIQKSTAFSTRPWVSGPAGASFL